MPLPATPDLNRYRAVLFDFDGTLAPCLDLRAMKQTVLDFTIAETRIERAAIESMMAIEFIEFTATWLEARERDASDYRERALQLIQDIEMQAAHDTPLYDGVLAVMQALVNRSIGIGIVTRNCEMAVREMFPEVDNYCAALYTRDQVPYAHLKPDPRHLLACINRLECEAADALMVGDGILDMRVAQELNMHRLAVLGGHNSEDDLAAAGANWIVPNVRDLIDWI